MSKILRSTLNEIRGSVDRNASSEDIVRAAHEAGHAVVTMALGHRVIGISIRAWDAYEAHVSWTANKPVSSSNDDEIRSWASGMAAIALAGDVAYDFIDPAILALGVQHDRGRTLGGDRDDVRSAFRVTGDAQEDMAAFAKRARTTAKQILQAHAVILDRLAVALLHHKRLNEADIRAIVGADLADRWQVRAAAA